MNDKNIYNLLMDLVSKLTKEGYKLSRYTILDIENDIQDREIHIIEDKKISMVFKDNKICLYTSYSNQEIDDNFIKNVTFLNTLKNQFNTISDN